MKRVLAIDPVTRGFGFAVLEGPDRLVDWGLKGTDLRSRNANRWCLRQLADLIVLYQPEVLVVEDATARESRRRQRVSQLIDMMSATARRQGVTVRAIPRRRVVRLFPNDGTTSKHTIALAIADPFPELGRRLPPIRKPWMSADARMAIFDAVAFALAFYMRSRRSEDRVADAESAGST